MLVVVDLLIIAVAVLIIVVVVAAWIGNVLWLFVSAVQGLARHLCQGGGAERGRCGGGE